MLTVSMSGMSSDLRAYFARIWYSLATLCSSCMQRERDTFTNRIGTLSSHSKNFLPY